MIKLTKFEKITANQLAIERGNKKPSEKLKAESIRKVKKWNADRDRLNLEKW